MSRCAVGFYMEILPMLIFTSFIELLKRIPGLRMQYPANNKDRHQFWERLALELADQPVGVFQKILAR